MAYHMESRVRAVDSRRKAAALDISHIEECPELLLGEGTYGKVYVATADGADKFKHSRQLVALKSIKLDDADGLPETTIVEIRALSALDHPNVVKLRGVVSGAGSSAYLVLDYAHATLKTLLRECALDSARVKCVLEQLLRGLEYMHRHGVIHRDVKPCNILVDCRTGRVQLADFGMAKSTATCATNLARMTNLVVTLWYRAPEILLGSRSYGAEIDMWAAGCVFAELLGGGVLFPGSDEVDQLVRIVDVLGRPSWPGVEKLPYYANLKPDATPRRKLHELVQSKGSASVRVSHEAYDLLCQMLQLDPARRIDAASALRHPYFSTGTRPCDPAALVPPDASISTFVVDPHDPKPSKIQRIR